jgi:peptidyl-prolyl cis-trans isomerase C
MAAFSHQRPMLPAGAALAAVLALSGCARADDAAVARVDGRTVWASDVRQEAEAQGLAPRNAPLASNSPVFHEALEQVIDRKLLAAEARKRGLDHDVATGQTDAANERLLSDRLVAAVTREAASESAVQALYREQAGGPEPAVTLAAARPQLVRFLAYDQIRDLLTTLRRRARIETLATSATAPSPTLSTPAPEGRS